MTSDRDYEEADALWEFVANPGQPPRDDVERTVRRVQGVVGAEQTAQAMPRDRIWSEVVTSAATSPVRPSRAATGLVPAVGWTRRRVGRWSSVVSYGLMVAVVFSLLGIAHDRVMSPALATPAPELIASDFIATEGTPVAEDGCVARDVTWEEPETPPVRTSLPQYEAKEPASREIGELALGTYIAYWTCLMNSQPAGTDVWDAIKTYVTGTFQPHAAGGMLQQQAAAEASTDGEYASREDEIVHNAVIPVNQPSALHHFPDETGIWGTSIKVFWPTNVYELIDGRYGVVIGSVSTDTFRTGSTGEDPFDDGTLTWVAFEEQNGQLFIDEIRPFCTGEWVAIDANGQPISTPMTEGEIGCR